MNNYNPDVLNCLANLSNDEVFTPPVLANQVLDMLPQELFCSPETKFLDPVSKSGVFLREIVKRLDRGLQLIIPDRQQRIDHIMHHQVFGIATTELTSYISRRSLYCSREADSQYSVSHFDNAEGNIVYRNLRHTWQKGKCKYCGASQEVYDRSSADEHYAYQFIHTDNPQKLFPKNMKFDVIIGNPPYQLSDGGQAASAKPLYHLFVQQALKLNPRFLTMIIPARWYAGGKGLDAFRNLMLEKVHLKELVDYSNSADCFPGVNIAGGVCYFMIDKDYKGFCKVTNMNSDKIISQIERPLTEFPILVRNNTAIQIIRKVLSGNVSCFNESVCSYNYFVIRSYERGYEQRRTNMDLVLLSSSGKGFIEREKAIDKSHLIKKYKVIITYAMSGGNKPTSKGDYQVISSLQVLRPMEVCTETYLVLKTFDDLSNANNCCEYYKTKFTRFLLLQALTSIHITKESFQFVPLQDFSHPWTDEMLYKKYGLTDEEIAFIESMIRPME